MNELERLERVFTDLLPPQVDIAQRVVLVTTRSTVAYGNVQDFSVNTPIGDRFLLSSIVISDIIKVEIPLDNWISNYAYQIQLFINNRQLSDKAIWSPNIQCGYGKTYQFPFMMLLESNTSLKAIVTANTPNGTDSTYDFDLCFHGNIV